MCPEIFCAAPCDLNTPTEGLLGQWAELLWCLKRRHGRWLSISIHCLVPDNFFFVEMCDSKGILVGTVNKQTLYRIRVYKQPLSMSTEDILTYTVGKAQVKIVKWMMAEFYFAPLVSGSWFVHAGSLSPLPTLEWYWAIINITSNTCTFHTVTTQHACCDKRPVAF